MVIKHITSCEISGSQKKEHSWGPEWPEVVILPKNMARPDGKSRPEGPFLSVCTVIHRMDDTSILSGS